MLTLLVFDGSTYEKATITTVRIITPHFANCEVNCSYCDCEVVNHTKNKKQFPSPSSQKNLNSSGSGSSKLYPYFFHPMYAIISRSIAFNQNYILKYKRCFAIVKKNFTCDGLKASLRSAYLLRSIFQRNMRTLSTIITYF